MSGLAAPRWKVVTAFAAVYVLWGSTYLAIRFAIETLPPFWMAAARFLTAGTLLYGWARWRGEPAPRLVHWRSAFVVGCLLLLGGNGGVVWAEQRVPSGLAALLVATVPLWMVLLDGAGRGWRRPPAQVLFGVGVGLAGVALLVGPGRFAGGGGVDPLGAAVLLVASVSWTAGSLYSRKAELPSSPFLGTAMQMLGGGAGLVLAGLVAGEPSRLDLAAASGRSLAALAFLIVLRLPHRLHRVHLAAARHDAGAGLHLRLRQSRRRRAARLGLRRRVDHPPHAARGGDHRRRGGADHHLPGASGVGEHRHHGQGRDCRGAGCGGAALGAAGAGPAGVAAAAGDSAGALRGRRGELNAAFGSNPRAPAAGAALAVPPRCGSRNPAAEVHHVAPS